MIEKSRRFVSGFRPQVACLFFALALLLFCTAATVAAAPTGFVLINDGDSYTTSASVTLTISATDPLDVDQMCISNSTTCSTWEPYQTSKPWTLPVKSAISRRTVYVWFSDHSGNVSPRPYIDSIVLDTMTAVHYVAIAAGYGHSVGLKSDGTLWAWGENYSGQLGDGTTIRSLMPKKIGTDNGWVAIEAGNYHTLALKSDGTLWAWGDNDYGQLGDGTTIRSLMPKR